jgi:hypothetical protein
VGEIGCALPGLPSLQLHPPAPSTGSGIASRHLHFDDCKKLGLDVELIEADPALQDLVLAVHHCFMHTLMNTNAFKIIENHLGHALMRTAKVMV